MGSFNETCALSGLSIRPDDPVKILFLTRNPYANGIDQQYACRGNYHTDHWFLRTPPISGIYNDYGKAEFKESYLTSLIEDLFSKDIVEQPFGFNKYYSPSISKNPTINQLLNLAWNGRLLIRDDGYASSVSNSYKRQREFLGLPEEEKRNYSHFPTWKKVFELLSKAELPMMLECDQKGYNAQDVRDGVVVVNFNDYSTNEEKLKKAIKVLDKYYDCKLVYKEHYQGKELFKTDPCLIVVAKGGFNDLSILMGPDLDNIQDQINQHPQHYKLTHSTRNLPVLAVMVRQDVWNVYSSIKYTSWCKDRDFSVNGFEKTTLEILKITDEEREDCKNNPDAIKSLKKNKKFSIERTFYNNSLSNFTCRTY